VPHEVSKGQLNPIRQLVLKLLEHAYGVGVTSDNRYWTGGGIKWTLF